MTTDAEKLEKIKKLCSLPHKKHSLTAAEVLCIVHDQDFEEVMKGSPKWLRDIWDIQKGE